MLNPGEGRAPLDVIIVSWNARAYLGDCLASLERLQRPAAEVLVIDNASSDGSAEVAQASPLRPRVLRAPDNLGFCRANNWGIRETSSPYVALLNPDTKVTPDFFERLMPAFDDPSVGIACGKLLRFDGRTLDSAGQRLGRSRQPKDRGYGGADDGRYDRDEEVFGACGAAVVYRREMLDTIADPERCYFDEAFFAFVEDLDLAWRARRLGWRAQYCHAAVAFHARGGSAAGPSWLRGLAMMLGRTPEIRYHVVKNRYLTILRNDRPLDYLKNLPFIWGRDLATLALLLLTSPSVLLRLWRNRGLFGAALAHRRLDEARPRHQVG